MTLKLLYFQDKTFVQAGKYFIQIYQIQQSFINFSQEEAYIIHRCVIYTGIYGSFVTRLARFTSGAGTAYPSGAPEFTPIFNGVCVTRSLVLCVCFVDRCLSFFFRPLCCLFFDLRILITSLVSSNSSCLGSHMNRTFER